MSETNNAVVNKSISSSTGREVMALKGVNTGNTNLVIFKINYPKIPAFKPFKQYFIKDNNDDNQSWFWSKEWQQKEAIVDNALKIGDYQDCKNIDDLMKALNS